VNRQDSDDENQQRHTGCYDDDHHDNRFCNNTDAITRSHSSTVIIIIIIAFAVILMVTKNHRAYLNQIIYFGQHAPIEKQTDENKEEKRNTFGNTKELNYNSYSYENDKLVH